MKIKKKIEVEIEIFEDKFCSVGCRYIDDVNPFCYCFRLPLELVTNGSWYNTERCKQCIEHFGMGE